MRNQVGAIVGPLVYLFLLEQLIGLIALGGSRTIMPRYSLGAVAKALVGRQPGRRPLVLGQVAGGLVLTLYVAVFLVAGMLLMQRRDVTA